MENEVVTRRLFEEMESDSPRIGVLEELLGKGADINHQDEDDWCVLADACLSHDVRLVEWMLEHGASPNLILEKSKSVLNVAEDDEAYHGILARNEDEGGENHAAVASLERIERVLLSYGAKTFSSIRTDRVRKWLQVFASDVTGLCTLDGHIKIEQIRGVSQSLVERFNSWYASHWDRFPREEGLGAPNGFDRESHNRTGYELSRELKSLLGPGIEVTYLSIDPKLEKDGVRNVHHQRIA